jgi:serine/threonine protein kinase
MGKKLSTVIGKGRQGIIYRGDGFAAKVCPRDLKAASRGEKQPSTAEFDIHTAVHKAAPSGVVDIFALQKCVNFIPPSAMNMTNVQNTSHYDKSKQTIIFMEYCSGGSLEGWLNELPRTDAIIHHIIASVMKTLANIYKAYPDFRHNDLHLENVFVADRGFLIGDFGWARIMKSGTNPAVNTANKTGVAGQWGVGPATDQRYDHHLFLNNLRAWVVKKGGFPKARAFLDVAVPVGYRGSSDIHVNEWRLKYKDPCTDLPTLAQILKSKYLSGRKFNSPNLVVARSRLKKVTFGRMKRVRSVNLAEARLRLRKTAKSPVRSSPRILRRASLKPVRPGSKITANMLKAAKSKLKEGKKTTKKVTAAMRKNKKFNKLVEAIWRNNGAISGKNYNNAWSSARGKAIRLVELRINRGNEPFSPNPRSVAKVPIPKLPSPRRETPSPPRRVSPPKNLAAAVKKLRNAQAKLVANRLKSKVIVAPPPVPIGRRAGANFQTSPGSKRVKILNPETGRMVYANGPAISMQYLKNLATRRGVNIKGIRAKNAIARKIFS